MDAMVYNWIDLIQETFFPSRCLLCGGKARHGRDLCDACDSALFRNLSPCRRCALPLPPGTPAGSICGHCISKPPPFEHCYAPLIYDNALSHLITGLKFHNKLQHAQLFAWLLCRYLCEQQAAMPDLLLPVPLHPDRQRQRGYNQALEIARPIARRFGLKLASHQVERLRDTHAQADLDKKKRQQNMRGAFRVSGGIEMQHIALLDDVVTTGSTVSELARTLQRAGAERVDVWAIARTP
jgi:ComF family protein